MSETSSTEPDQQEASLAATHGPGLALAIVCNSLPPYRLHAHRRFAAELEGVRLITINTHHDTARAWQVGSDPTINFVDVSGGDTMADKRGGTGALREWTRGKRIVDVLDREKIDAVIINGYNDLGRVRALQWCHRRGIPVFVWGDSNIASDHAAGVKKRVKAAWIRWLDRHVSGFFACGSLGRAYWESYGIAADRIFISPYEPDYRLIRGLDDDAIAAAQRRYGLEPSRRSLVFSGRLVPVKRADLLIDAFNRLADDRPEWDLVIIGDGELREALQARVRPDLNERVIWPGFLAEQREVSRIYRACDVLVLPSDYEPWALVVNEAAAAGLAIVASDVVGAAAELVAQGDNGFTFPAGDGEALLSALRRVTDPDRIDQYKAASSGVLADWQQRGDPVEGIRRALRHVRLL